MYLPLLAEHVLTAYPVKYSNKLYFESYSMRIFLVVDLEVEKPCTHASETTRHNDIVSTGPIIPYQLLESSNPRSLILPFVRPSVGLVFRSCVRIVAALKTTRVAFHEKTATRHTN